MSISYKLELIKATKKIMVDDNVDPNPPSERCMHYYIADRIFQGTVPLNGVTLPHVTIDYDGQNSDGDLPSEHGILMIRSWVEKDKVGVRELISRMNARVIGLFDHNSDVFKSNNSNITVRLCDKILDQIVDDPASMTLHGYIIFDVIHRKN
jgi:hypothetical protein